MHHTDRRALHDQRDAEQRADAALAENRVHHVGVVDVADHDRPHVGRDPAGEPAAERDAAALPDLLLEPARGARHDLTGVTVEQQHGDRVHLEDRLHPFEQLLEHVVEREMRERPLAHGLHVAQPPGCCAGNRLGVFGVGVGHWRSSEA